MNPDMKKEVIDVRNSKKRGTVMESLLDRQHASFGFKGTPLTIALGLE
jgi:hypothetical protein